MLRAHMRPVVGALAATLLLLGLAACGKSSHKKEGPPPPPPPPANDILKGAGMFTGTFDPSNWRLQAPDDATLAVAPCSGFTSNCATIAGADLGQQDYDAQLIYWSGADDAPSYVTLKAGKKYTVQLRASASAASQVSVALEDVVYQVVSSSTFSVTTTPTVYTGDPVDIPASGSDREVAVKINVGGTANAGRTFHVDDLFILEEDGTPPPPPTGNDLLSQGDFESSPGTNIWHSWSNDGGNATFAIADCSADGLTGKCMTVAGSNFGSNPWSTQFIYWDSTAADAKMLAIDASKTYTVTFKARASADGVTIQTVLQGSKATYSPTYTLSKAITTTATDYSMNFTGLTSGNLGFKMQFQSTASGPVTIEVDDIHLLED